MVVESKEQLREALGAIAAGQPAGGAVAEPRAGQLARKDGPRTVLLFRADGSNGRAGNELYATQPVFRAAVDRCARLLAPSNDASLLAAFSQPGGNAERRDVAQFALQYALAELWRSWGVEPDAVLGAGIGEYAAAVVSAVLSCEDAVRLVAARARLLQLPLHDGELNRMLDEFERTAVAVKFECPRIPFVSSLTGQFLSADEIPGAAYWRLQVSQGARLDAGMETLVAKGYDHFLEIGPAAAALSRNTRVRGSETKATFLSTLEENCGAWQSLLASLATLYVRGAGVNWKSFDEPYQPLKIPLPVYPFERERCWQDPYTEPGAKKPAKVPHPLLGERIRSALPMPHFHSKIGLENAGYL